MKNFFRSLSVNVIGLCGIALIVGGLAQWSVPLACIVTGLFFTYAALSFAKPQKVD